MSADKPQKQMKCPSCGGTLKTVSKTATAVRSRPPVAAAPASAPEKVTVAAAAPITSAPKPKPKSKFPLLIVGLILGALVVVGGVVVAAAVVVVVVWNESGSEVLSSAQSATAALADSSVEMPFGLLVRVESLPSISGQGVLGGEWNRTAEDGERFLVLHFEAQHPNDEAPLLTESIELVTRGGTKLACEGTLMDIGVVAGNAKISNDAGSITKLLFVAPADQREFTLVAEGNDRGTVVAPEASLPVPLDDPQKEPTTPTNPAPKPPVALVSGEAIPAAQILVHHAIMEVGERSTPGRGDGLTMVPKGGSVSIRVEALQIVDANDDEKWQYEIRPVGTQYLTFQVNMQGKMILGHIKFGRLRDDVIWQDQPYEVIGPSGKVVYAHPDQSRVGDTRETFSSPTDPNSQFIAE